MRHAILVSPSPHTSQAPPGSGDARSWLHAALRDLAFEVTAVTDGPGGVEVALSRVPLGDVVMIHLRGHLLGAVALRALSDLVLLREPSSALILAELTHDGSAEDALLAAEHVETIEAALDARARGFAALVAVRHEHATAVPLAFTRLVLEVATGADARNERGAALLSDVYARVRATPESHAAAQCFALVRGAVDFELAPPKGVAAMFADALRRTGPSVAAAPAPVAPARDRTPTIPDDDADVDPPDLDALLELSGHAAERHAWAHAAAGFRAALLVLRADDHATRANILTRIGTIERTRGRRAQAERAFEKALEACPEGRPAIDALVEIAEDAEDWLRSTELRKRRLARFDAAESGARVDELLEIARVLAEHVRDVRTAVESLEAAHAIDPARADVLEALRRAYIALDRWPKVIEVTGALVDRAESPEERAELRLAQARVALERLGDHDRGTLLLEAALELDPTSDQALEALVAARSARGQHVQLDLAVAKLVDRFARMGDVRRAWTACCRLGALRRDAGDIAGAIEALTGALRLYPDDLDSRAALAELFLVDGDEDGALVELERVAAQAPLHVPTHSRLFALHVSAERTDRAYFAALALEELDAAHATARAVLEQHRHTGPLRARASLDDTSWSLLRAPGKDDVVEAIFAAISRPAIAASIDERRERKKLVSLDPAQRQSATSTATIVRSFHWAARVLEVACPALYVLDEVPGDVAAVPLAEPSTAFGPGVLRGLSTKDLAFVAGRHVTYYRPEYNVLVYFPTVDELRVLLVAAVQLALADVAPPSGAGPVSSLRARLARHATEDDRAAVADAARRLDARGGRADLAAWARGVELTAARAGLLLCGDLRTAMTRIRAEMREGRDGIDSTRADLLAFSASRGLADLHEALAGGRTSIYPRAESAWPASGSGDGGDSTRGQAPGSVSA